MMGRLVLTSVALLITFAASNSIVRRLESVGEFSSEILHSQDTWVVGYVAPWCQHCKSLPALFQQVAVSAAESGTRVRTALVDVALVEDVVDWYGLRSFPGIILFPSDKQQWEYYDGNRNAAAILEFVQQRQLLVEARAGTGQPVPEPVLKTVGDITITVVNAVGVPLRLFSLAHGREMPEALIQPGEKMSVQTTGMAAEGGGSTWIARSTSAMAAAAGAAAQEPASWRFVASPHEAKQHFLVSTSAHGEL
jgi:thiol-disulfide isomerase/thioredoxin